MISTLRKYFRRTWFTAKNLPTTVLAPLAIGFTGLTVTGVLVGMRHAGWLESPELVAYDQMMRLRPDMGTDPRLLVVAVTEADIKAQKRYPLSDQTVADLLQRLQQHHPKVIGLDIHRDLPYEPGNQALSQELKQPNVIAITKLPDVDDVGVDPPPGMPSEQIGFNDLAIDNNRIVRRNLMFAEADADHSLSLRLALAYLKDQNIALEEGTHGGVRLGKAEFLPLEHTSGQYQALDSAGFQVLLDYRSRRNLVHQVSLTEVLTGQVDPNLIQDKIVLIGATARSTKDSFSTPYSVAEPETPLMPGVIIHAQAVSALLDAATGKLPLFWFWDDWLEVLWIAAWTLVGGSLAWLMRHPLMFGLAGMGAIALLLGSCYALFLQHGWVPVASPLIGLVTTAMILVVYQGQQAFRQQQMMMKLLGQNTSPEIATALWKSRDRLLKSGKLPGQRLVATMLFTDIKNFSTISEQMPPENLLEWLNEYLSVITHEVIVSQGIINKFTGDGMLAVFGVPMNRTTPIEVSQDAQLAVACALEMGERLKECNQDWQKRGLPVVQMRVGIFTGPIVVGSLGGKDRLEYGVIGDSVNIASRLESYDKTRQADSDLCRVLIAKETLEHLHGKFAVEAWGPLALKGKHQTVNVYRVLGWAKEVMASAPATNPSLKQGIETTEAI